MKNLIKKHGAVFLFLSILVLISYVNSLNNAFVSDDISTIANNARLNDLPYIISHPLYSPRWLLYFIINFLFGLNPVFFRLLNIFFHIGNVAIFYCLLYIFTKIKLAAFLAAALFAVHPLSVEAVAWISGGPYPQYSFFIISSFLLYILAKNGKKWPYIISIVSYIIGLLSLHMAIVYVAVIILYEWAHGDIKKNSKKLLPYIIASIVFTVLYSSQISARVEGLAAANSLSGQTENPLLQIPVAISYYFQLFLWPSGLTLYHSEFIMGHAEYILRFVIFISYLTAIAVSFKKNKKLFFFLTFFLIVLSPTLLPFSLSWIVAERYVYLGLVGTVGAISIVLAHFLNHKKYQTIIVALCSLIVVVLMMRTIARNTDWKNEDTLWIATGRTSPSSPQNHNNLGDVYSRRGDFVQAEGEFKKAIELNPEYADAYHNLGATYQQMGNVSEAEANYKKALVYNPQLWQTYQSLAILNFKQKKIDKAMELMQKAIKLSPQNSKLYINMAIMQYQTGKKDEAKKIFETVLQFDPQNEKALLGLQELSK